MQIIIFVSFKDLINEGRKSLRVYSYNSAQLAVGHTHTHIYTHATFMTLNGNILFPRFYN